MRSVFKNNNKLMACFDKITDKVKVYSIQQLAFTIILFVKIMYEITVIISIYNTNSIVWVIMSVVLDLLILIISIISMSCSISQNEICYCHGTNEKKILGIYPGIFIPCIPFYSVQSFFMCFFMINLPVPTNILILVIVTLIIFAIQIFFAIIWYVKCCCIDDPNCTCCC